MATSGAQCMNCRSSQGLITFFQASILIATPAQTGRSIVNKGGNLFTTLSKSLNYLQTGDCRKMLQGLAMYNNDVLNVDALASRMGQIVDQRHANMESSSEYLKGLRNCLKNELDSDQL